MSKSTDYDRPLPVTDPENAPKEGQLEPVEGQEEDASA